MLLISKKQLPTKKVYLLLGDTHHVLGKQVQRGHHIVTYLNQYDTSIVYENGFLKRLMHVIFIRTERRVP